MSFDLETMRWAIPALHSIERSSANSFCVRAVNDATATLPFRKTAIPLGKMMGRMFHCGKGNKIIGAVIVVVAVLVMNMKRLFLLAITNRNRPIVLFVKPNVIGLAVSILHTFARRCFERGQRITSELQSLVVLGAEILRVRGFVAVLDGANGSFAGQHTDRIDLCFQRIASRLEAIVVKAAPLLAKRWAVTFKYSALFWHTAFLAFLYRQVNRLLLQVRTKDEYVSI